MQHDTIFALSSGAGMAAVAVIRISGPCASQAVRTLCGDVPAPRRASVRFVKDPANGDVIDEAVILWMPGPSTFTGEDAAEFQVHGGAAIVAAVLRLLGETEGLRIAEPGEFTRRALLNGRMDPVAVEGLADLLAARTEQQRRQAWFHKEGKAARQYDAWRASLVRVLAHLEAAIDFVDEEGVEADALENVAPALTDLITTIERELDDARRGQQLRDGVHVVLAGPPNAGKSSLLNVIARREAAIVSPVPGTTRDVIEVFLDLKGIPVILSDTAGLRDDGGDEIEELGMSRAREAVRRAGVVIWMMPPDVSAQVPEPDFDSEAIRVLSKADLIPEGWNLSCRTDLAVSAQTGEGVEALIDILGGKLAQIYSTHEPALVTRERHRVALQSCLDHLRQALAEKDAPLELVAERVRLAARDLARVTGRIDVEELLDVIFRDFCIGK